MDPSIENRFGWLHWNLPIIETREQLCQVKVQHKHMDDINWLTLKQYVFNQSESGFRYQKR